MKQIARLDERIKVITQSNLGVSAARNEGIKHSKGKYLTFVDADDVLVPYFFSEYKWNISIKCGYFYLLFLSYCKKYR